MDGEVQAPGDDASGPAQVQNGRPRWWCCPNDPPCPHGGLVHDVYDLEDEVPRCCADGCSCGKRPAGKDGPVTRAEYAASEIERQFLGDLDGWQPTGVRND